MAIRVGDKAARKFVIDATSMRWFLDGSQDASRIHCDRGFAQSRGYADVIAYGGIFIAHLSHVLGMHLPGSSATSLAWSIKFHEPLYVGEEAEILLEIAHISASTGVVEGKFKIMTRDKLVASGTTQSIVPAEEIEQ